jgi:hypothetical protein
MAAGAARLLGAAEAVRRAGEAGQHEQLQRRRYLRIGARRVALGAGAAAGRGRRWAVTPLLQLAQWRWPSLAGTLWVAGVRQRWRWSHLSRRRASRTAGATSTRGVLIVIMGVLSAVQEASRQVVEGSGGRLDTWSRTRPTGTEDSLAAQHA